MDALQAIGVIITHIIKEEMNGRIDTTNEYYDTLLSLQDLKEKIEDEIIPNQMEEE